MMSQYNPNLNQAVVDDHRRALVAAAAKRRLAAAVSPVSPPSERSERFLPPANEVSRFSPQRTK
jgi:hypothetical protein